MAHSLGYLLLFISALAVGVKAYHRHGYHEARIMKRQTTPCDPTEKFRRPDGRCNNLDNPDWGAAGSIMPRFQPSAYANGMDSPRTNGVSSNALPGARKISLDVHGPNDATAKITLMVMQWGQFLDHDMTIVPHPSVDPDCCTNVQAECFNIAIPPEDGYFTGRDCMPFVRSSQTKVDGVGEQTNSITAYIDGSMVYGSSEEHMQELRGTNGRLRTLQQHRSDYLPAAGDSACRNETGEHCFLAGDERVNEQPGLAAMHTIFVREHNRIAGELRKVNTDWSSDQIFQVARDIVIAEIQHITYDAFLPLVLGPVFMERYNLKTNQPYTYNTSIDAGIRNEFATAAYRFGHSLIPEDITVNNEALMFKNLFLKPSTVLESMGGLAESLAREPSMAMDRQFAHSVTQHLFQEEERQGSDLVALNIQRGRDHGLQPLNAYRKICSGNPFTSLAQLFPRDTTAQATYEDIDDVDLFTGGVAEDAVDEGLVGQTFACLLATQFSFLRHGDRFFYLNRDRPNRFNREQMEEIRQVTLGKIICDNTENDRIQSDVFLPAKVGNERKECSNLPSLDLRKWGGGGGGRDGGGGDGGPRRG
ncbi:hypothetical protein EGW08_020159 [Elysia chlorotica]|uniref:Uncharacterized protein n=1 Tax=Elysia chlorotica TaxID=188477 RepID=A0A3S1B500_ELYCH|nr:hypothetical protein EGW08_020159 [Elysia chlorotica]